MPYSRRPKAEGHSRKRLTNANIVASGVRDVKSTGEFMSNETDITIVDQRSAGTGTSNSEMFVVNEDCDSDAPSTVTKNIHMHRDSKKGPLGGVAPFIERNPASSRQQHSTTAEQRWRASLENEIARIRRHFHMQEGILEKEIVKLEQMYERDMKQLEKEEKGEEYYPVAGWWEPEVQSDYEPTECGDEGACQ